MTEFQDRFHDLDGLDVPDVYARARAIGPKEPQEPRPSAARRMGVILLASLVAAAGFGLLLRARDKEDGTPATTTSIATPTATPTGSVAPAPQGLLAFAAQSRGSSTGLVIGSLGVLNDVTVHRGPEKPLGTNCASARNGGYQPRVSTWSRVSTKKSAADWSTHSGGFTLSTFIRSLVGWITTPRSSIRSQAAAATSNRAAPP